MTNKNIEENSKIIKNNLILTDIIKFYKYIKTKTR